MKDNEFELGKPAITIEDVRAVPGYENIPVQEAQEMIEAIHLFSVVAFNCVIKSKCDTHD